MARPETDSNCVPISNPYMPFKTRLPIFDNLSKTKHKNKTTYARLSPHKNKWSNPKSSFGVYSEIYTHTIFSLVCQSATWVFYEIPLAWSKPFIFHCSHPRGRCLIASRSLEYAAVEADRPGLCGKNIYK